MISPARTSRYGCERPALPSEITALLGVPLRQRGPALLTPNIQAGSDSGNRALPDSMKPRPVALDSTSGAPPDSSGVEDKARDARM